MTEVAGRVGYWLLFRQIPIKHWKYSISIEYHHSDYVESRPRHKIFSFQRKYKIIFNLFITLLGETVCILFDHQDIELTHLVFVSGLEGRGLTDLLLSQLLHRKPHCHEQLQQVWQQCTQVNILDSCCSVPSLIDKTCYILRKKVLLHDFK